MCEPRIIGTWDSDSDGKYLGMNNANVAGQVAVGGASPTLSQVAGVSLSITVPAGAPEAGSGAATRQPRRNTSRPNSGPSLCGIIKEAC